MQPAVVNFPWPPPLYLVEPPTIPQLMDRASLVPTKEGGGNIGRVWICPDCETKNFPMDCLLLKLHPIRYSNSACRILNPTGYAWSIVDAVLNGVKLNMYIHNQGNFGTCTAHALVAGIDLSRRVSGALRRLVTSQPLDVHNLLRKFYDIYDEPLGREQHPLLRGFRIPCLLSIAQERGVGFLMPRFMHPDMHEPLSQVLKIQSSFVVNTSDPDRVVQLLAGGFPLLTGVPIGRCFSYLASGQIYDAPQVDSSHAVLLIGFGVANWPGEDEENSALSNWPVDKNKQRCPRLFFRARNSHGDQSHPNWSLAGKGGDFDVWADQIFGMAYGFHLKSN